MKKSEVQKEHIFVLGLIEETNARGKTKIGAMRIYNPVTEESSIESMSSIGKRLKKGESIIGVRITSETRYDYKNEEYVVKEEVKLSNQNYKFDKLPMLNGKGEVIIPGNGVVVGAVERKGELKYVVVSNSLHKQYLTEDEVLQGDYVGVMRKQVIRASQCRLDKLKEDISNEG